MIEKTEYTRCVLPMVFIHVTEEDEKGNENFKGLNLELRKKGVTEWEVEENQQDDDNSQPYTNNVDLSNSSMEQ